MEDKRKDKEWTCQNPKRHTMPMNCKNGDCALFFFGLQACNHGQRGRLNFRFWQLKKYIWLPKIVFNTVFQIRQTGVLNVVFVV